MDSELHIPDMVIFTGISRSLNEIFFRNSEKKYRSGSLLTAGYLI